MALPRFSLDRLVSHPSQDDRLNIPCGQILRSKRTALGGRLDLVAIRASLGDNEVQVFVPVRTMQTISISFPS